MYPSLLYYLQYRINLANHNFYSMNLITQLVTIYDLQYLQKNPCCCHHLLILLNINVHKFLYDQEEYGNDDIGSKGIWVRELREECVSNRKGNVVREFLSTWLGINSHGISKVPSCWSFWARSVILYLLHNFENKDIVHRYEFLYVYKIIAWLFFTNWRIVLSIKEGYEWLTFVLNTHILRIQG